jgi:hypothetical protein
VFHNAFDDVDAGDVLGGVVGKEEVDSPVGWRLPLRVSRSRLD